MTNVKPTIEQTVAIITAYENVRLGAVMEDMVNLYGNQIGGYLEEKHNRHLDFVPFVSGLDHHHEKSYAQIVLDHMESSLTRGR
jgi:hypothetical protein